MVAVTLGHRLANETRYLEINGCTGSIAWGAPFSGTCATTRLLRIRAILHTTLIVP